MKVYVQVHVYMYMLIYVLCKVHLMAEPSVNVSVVFVPGTIVCCLCLSK